MSTKRVDPCKACGKAQSSIVVCDHCAAEAPSMPIEVRSTIEGDTDYDNYCSLPCLLAARIGAEGVSEKDGYGGWQHLVVTIDGRSAVNAIKAMGGKVSE
jgi:hypothetical protein